MADHEAAADSVVAVAPQLDRETALAQWRTALALIDNEVSAADGMGRFDPERVIATWTWAATAQGLDPDVIDPLDAVDMSFIE